MWKCKCPLKSHMFAWLGLRNKLITWDNLQKMNKSSLGRCSLCKEDEEIVAIICSDVKGLMTSMLSYYSITIHTTFPIFIYIKNGCM
jgi:hypothetical protein